MTAPIPLFAEINIHMVPPNLGEYSSLFETELQNVMTSSLSDLESQLTDVTNKQKFSKGVGKSVGLNSALPQFQLLPEHLKYSISIGGSAAVYSYTENPTEISNDLSNFDLEKDDYEIGASIRAINIMGTFPLKKWANEVSGFASIGVSSLEIDKYFLRNFYAQAGIGYTPIPEIGKRRSLKWTPLYVQVGASYGYHSFGTQFQADAIEQSFNVDPDGSGPLESKQVSISIDPKVNIALTSHLGSLIFSSATGIDILNSLHLYFGIGLIIVYGKTEFLVDSNDEIKLQGYFEDYVEKPGSIEITGVSGTASPTLGLESVFGGVQFDVSKIFINVPILYNPRYGISSGISLGVRL